MDETTDFMYIYMKFLTEMTKKIFFTLYSECIIQKKIRLIKSPRLKHSA